MTKDELTEYKAEQNNRSARNQVVFKKLTGQIKKMNQEVGKLSDNVLVTTTLTKTKANQVDVLNLQMKMEGLA